MKFSKKYAGTVASGSNNSIEWMPEWLPWLRPGTLNVKMDAQIPKIAWEKEIETNFKRPCRVARCKINNVDAFLINPPLVGIDPPRYLAEVGSELGLRDLLSLQDGDRVFIQFWTEEASYE
jgi:CTP-dependent riboflavin kinase